MKHQEELMKALRAIPMPQGFKSDTIDEAPVAEVEQEDTPGIRAYRNALADGMPVNKAVEIGVSVAKAKALEAFK